MWFFQNETCGLLSQVSHLMTTPANTRKKLHHKPNAHLHSIRLYNSRNWMTLARGHNMPRCSNIHASSSFQKMSFSLLWWLPSLIVYAWSLRRCCRCFDFFAAVVALPRLFIPFTPDLLMISWPMIPKAEALHGYRYQCWIFWVLCDEDIEEEMKK